MELLLFQANFVLQSVCPNLIGKHRFVHKISVHNFCAPYPPPPNQQIDGFPLEFLFEGPQAEARTLSQNCKKKPFKNSDKQNYEQTGVSD